jgi:hypothetical protein
MRSSVDLTAKARNISTLLDVVIIISASFQLTLIKMLPSVGLVIGAPKIYDVLSRRWGDISHINRWKDFDADIELGDLDNLFAKEEEIKQRIDLPNEFQTLTGRSHPPSSRMVFNYLRKRGVEEKDILYWKIGYCGSGEYKNRVILPSFDEEGYCNFFTSRTHDPNVWPPYMNGPGNKDIIFNELLIDWEREVTLVEGVFDAIVAGENSIPLLGSTLREDSKLFMKIVRNDTPVLLGLDADAHKKAMRLVKALLAYDVEVRLMDTQGIRISARCLVRCFNNAKKRLPLSIQTPI